MTRRILSLAIALVATVLGYLAFWTGGATVALASSYTLRPGALDVGALALVVLGLILLAVAALTVALSSLGVIVVGAFHLLVGLVSILSPMNDLMSRPVTYQVFNELLGRNDALNQAFYSSVPTGVGLVVGTVFLMAGIAARGRVGLVNRPWRIVAPIVAVIFGLGGVVLVLSQGIVIYTSQLRMLRWDVNLGVVSSMLIGVVLVAVAVLPVRWSSAGAFVFGGILTAYGVFSLLAPGTVAEVLMPVSVELGTAHTIWASYGNLALIGLLFIAVGFGARTRGRRSLLRTLAPGQGPAVAHGDPATV